MPVSEYDLVIVGGGIAGLWTLAEAKNRGINAILLEADTLGGAQTLASQGIIHGGSKYALGGKKTRATSIISSMPSVWESSYSQTPNIHNDINISNANMLSRHQYLIPASGIDTKLLSFLGSKTMSSHTRSINADNLPEAYKSIGINQTIFELNEMVFDTRSIVECFRQKYKDSIGKKRLFANNLKKLSDESINIEFDEHTLHCQHVLFTCGEGFSDLNQEKPAMQIRPLNMVLLRGKNLPLIYAHFIGRSTKPLLTITSHPTESSGDVIWYLGGGIAEDGVTRSDDEQIESSRELLSKLLPNTSAFDDAAFSCFRVNRAEPKQKGLVRPDDAYTYSDGNIHTAWPTKLALAPRLAQKALDQMTFTHHSKPNSKLPFELPESGLFPWEYIQS